MKATKLTRRCLTMTKREEYYNNLQEKLGTIVKDGQEDYDLSRAWSGDYRRIIVSQAGFFNELNPNSGKYISGYEDVWQVAVHVAVSYYIDLFQSEENITSTIINTDVIADFLNLKDRRDRANKRINKALTELEELGIIEVIPQRRNGFIVKQAQSYNKTHDKYMNNYFNLSLDSVDKILDSDESDNNKVNLLSAYCAIASVTNRLTEEGYNRRLKKQGSHSDNYTKINAVRGSICFYNQKNLGLSIGMKKRDRFKKYTDILFEKKIVFLMQVQHPRHNQEFEFGKETDTTTMNYYTLYEDRTIMYHYFNHILNQLTDGVSKTSLENIYDFLEYNPQSATEEDNEEMEKRYINELGKIHEENQGYVDTRTGEDTKTYVPNDNKHAFNYKFKTDLKMDVDEDYEDEIDKHNIDYEKQVLWDEFLKEISI